MYIQVPTVRLHGVIPSAPLVRNDDRVCTDHPTRLALSLAGAHALWMLDVAAGLHRRVGGLAVVAQRTKRRLHAHIELRAHVLKVRDEIGRWRDRGRLCWIRIEVEYERRVVSLRSRLQLLEHRG